jgi:hypothetical protein
MKKIEFLAANLPNGLKLKAPYGFRPNYKESTGVPRIVFLTGDLYADIENKTFPDDFIPIVRPLSDLTKPITQANYNDGKEFVPITELLKNNNFNTERMTFDAQCKYLDSFTTSPSFEDGMNLLMWHFDLITEDCEKVLVTDEFNPYK